MRVSYQEDRACKPYFQLHIDVRPRRTQIVQNPVRHQPFVRSSYGHAGGPGEQPCFPTMVGQICRLLAKVDLPEAQLYPQKYLSDAGWELM
jgi:hypothetical protein